MKPKTEIIAEPEFDFSGKFISDKNFKSINLDRFKRVTRSGNVFVSKDKEELYKNSAMDLFNSTQFSNLNKLFTEINGLRTVSGGSLADICSTKIMSQDDGLEKAKSWNESKDNSEFSEFFYAKYLVSLAWKHRGNGYAHTVSEAGWKNFRKYNLEAVDHLIKSMLLNHSFSPSLVTMASIQASCSFSDIGYDVWLNTAYNIEPYNLSIFTSAINYSQPKWGGSRKQLEE